MFIKIRPILNVREEVRAGKGDSGLRPPMGRGGPGSHTSV